MGRFSQIIHGTPQAKEIKVTDKTGSAQRIEPELVSNARPIMQSPKAIDTKSAVDSERVDAKMRIHSRLIDEIDLSMLDRLDDDELRDQVYGVVKDLASDEKMILNAKEKKQFASEVYDEMVGLGPLEPLLQDDSIADILINGHKQVYIERGGELEITPVRFRDDAHLLRIINRIVSQVGRRVDESMPMCDARLLDGSRVNVAIAPIAVDGPLVSIRKFSKKPFTFDKLVEFGAMPKEVAEFLKAACASRVTILISGGTGSGKTTLLNALSQSISHKERLITIEDAAELQLQQPHVARMETRPPNIEGKGEIRQRELVKNALRMRPDRVILGEVRGEEAFDMLQAMNTGHEGSLATLHANTPRDAITRLEQMVAMGDMKITPEAVAGQIASAIGMIIQATRLSDGQRKITSVAEITGMEGAIIQMQEIFKYKKLGTDSEGKVIGEHRATGIRPKCLDHIITRGLNVNTDIFEPKTLGPKGVMPQSASNLTHPGLA
ncbi:CpaF family protein [Robiginitomaculum antarcticum]|uniref:CpaF family protein n=1 Tax=Robiginitomaculum antarcticum TaxID=437507 RepID=UPI0003705211|nr:CpaF family protein [Robiginitomaculum antarcticum]